MRQNLVHQLMKADVQMVEAQSVGEDPCLKLQKLKVSMDGHKPNQCCFEAVGSIV